MKKIFAFIGSPLKEKSNTFTLTKMVLERLIEIDPEISFDIYTAGHVRLNFCKGCWLCMTKGFCPQDNTDDMKMLKEKMLSADFIIFGSPVYTYTISGQMKTFLDRLAAWYHIIRLAGKPGMTVSTTAGGGLKEVSNLLSMLLCALGVYTVTNIELDGCYVAMISEPERAKTKALDAAEKVYPYISGEKHAETNEDMEMAFKSMKSKSVGAKQWLPADYEYWKNSGMLDINSYAELLEKLRKTNKDI